MQVTGYSRWQKAPKGFRFWDYRPFSRVLCSFKEFLTLKNYIQINQLEGLGYTRSEAKYRQANYMLTNST